MVFSSPVKNLRKSFMQLLFFSSSLPFFICGEADRSGRGRCCCSSSSCCCCCCCCWGIWGDCFQNSHVHSKWVHPEKTLLQNGCIQRKNFFKMGASRENFPSKWVHPEKTFLQNGCIQRKHFFKMGALRQNFTSKWVHQVHFFCRV